MFGNASPQASSGSNTQRLKKRARVVAVADRRTTSIVVTASKDMMPQLEQIVAELDANPAHKQSVQIYQLQNAAPRQLVKVLQDLFDKSGTSASRSRSSSSTETDPLETRSTQPQQSTSTSSSRPGAGGGGAGSGGAAGMGGSGAGAP